jgi:hypothetical protein
MKTPLSNTRRFIPAALGLAVCLLASNAMAQSQYFGVTAGIVNGGTYSWDAANWSVAAGSSSGPFTYNWAAGDFARFYGGAGDNYTVTVGTAEANTGLYNDGAGTTLNINDNGSGLGNLYLNSGLDAFITTSSGYTYVNVPITGPGTLCPETSGNIYFAVANSYTGGTALGESGNALANFNNNLAFSTGTISLHRTGIGNFSTLLPYGGSTITLANNFQATSDVGTGTGLNFAGAANTPVVSSGSWSLGTYNLNLRSSGGSTSPLTISGAISGSGILALSANNTGNKTILSAVNPFTGTVIVNGVSGAYGGTTYGGSGAITLQLGAANALANISGLVLVGGTTTANGPTFNPGGFNQAMPNTTLTLSAAGSVATIDFGAGHSVVTFADSHLNTWSGVLNLVNWSAGDVLIIGASDNSGLTTAQLDDIEFNGTGLATAQMWGGAVMIPEPSTALLGLLGLGALWIIRRRTV